MLVYLIVFSFNNLYKKILIIVFHHLTSKLLESCMLKIILSSITYISDSTSFERIQYNYTIPNHNN